MLIYGVTASVVSIRTPANEAEMVIAVFADTGLVLTVNVTEFVPAGTVTVRGTFATAVLLLPSLTTAPFEGALRVRVTVPCDAAPPFTVAGSSVRDARVIRGAVLMA